MKKLLFVLMFSLLISSSILLGQEILEEEIDFDEIEKSIVEDHALNYEVIFKDDYSNIWKYREENLSKKGYYLIEEDRNYKFYRNCDKKLLLTIKEYKNYNLIEVTLFFDIEEYSYFIQICRMINDDKEE